MGKATDSRDAVPRDDVRALVPQIRRAATAGLEEATRLLQALVRVPSVNPWFLSEHAVSRESGVQDILTDRLSAVGAEIDRWEPNSGELARYEGTPGHYPGRDFTGRPNLVARLPGGGGGRSLLILGHADVVSPGEGWSMDPFAAERRDGKVYGRGAADMKGGIASAVGAVVVLTKLGIRLKGDILIASVVDEEAGGMGTLAVVDRGYRADGAIIPEPSDLNVAPLCRGILWGRLTVPGRSGHIEMPQPDWRAGGAVDAIAHGRRVLNAIDELNAEWRSNPAKSHPLLPLPNQIRAAMIAAGEYPTAYAERMQITFNAQYLPGERDERGLGTRVKHEVEDFFAALSGRDPWLREHPLRVEWLVDADCAETAADAPLPVLVHSITEQLGLRGHVEGMSSHTDMGLLVNAGIPTINFGPGSPSVAHRADEFVSETDLLDAMTALLLTLIFWCGRE
jgi:acetylornithine deacetylase